MKAVPRCNSPKAAPGPKTQKEREKQHHPTPTLFEISPRRVSPTKPKMCLSVSACNFVVHDRCLKTVVSPCSSIAATITKVTVVAITAIICAVSHPFFNCRTLWRTVGQSNLTTRESSAMCAARDLRILCLSTAKVSKLCCPSI